uniref:C2 domain-containing protein n=1 Tax=Ditylenchus dipsaci TaxID=166011 RepID=A0A915EMP0_9BILA
MDKSASDTHSLILSSQHSCVSAPCPTVIICEEQGIEVISSRKASLHSLHVSSSSNQLQRRSIGSISSNTVKVESSGGSLPLPLSNGVSLENSNHTTGVSDNLLLGKLKLALQYSRQKKLLILTVLEVNLDREDKDTSKTDDNVKKELNTQVRLALLAEKVVKFRTKYRSNAVFNETFVFNILPDELVESVVRCRLYQKRVRSNGLLGEAFLKASVVDSSSGSSSQHSLNIRPPPSTIHSSMSLPHLLSRNSTPSATTTISSTPSSNHFQHPLPANHSSGHGTPVSTPTMPQVASVIAASNYNSASRRSSTVDDCGRFCSLPQSNGTPEVLVSLCYVQDQSNVIVGVEKATGFDSAHR